MFTQINDTQWQYQHGMVNYRLSCQDDKSAWIVSRGARFILKDESLELAKQRLEVWCRNIAKSSLTDLTVFQSNLEKAMASIHHELHSALGMLDDDPSSHHEKIVLAVSKAKLTLKSIYKD